jgi:hypothetical protein
MRRLRTLEMAFQASDQASADRRDGGGAITRTRQANLAFERETPCQIIGLSV